MLNVSVTIHNSILKNNNTLSSWQNDLSLVSRSSTIFWFRRDLRLADNAGLYHALKERKNVLPVFIFDSLILKKLEDEDDARVNFIHHSLKLLKAGLEEQGSSLLILCGNPKKIYAELDPEAVYTNHDYEPYARRRDEAVRKTLKKKGIAFKSFKDQVIFERNEVMKDDDTPYTIFTPYSRKWKSVLTKFHLKDYPVEKYFRHLFICNPQPLPTLAELGFRETNIQFPERVVKRSIIEKYDNQRNFPGIHGTTHLGIHLRFGTVSIRKLAQLAVQKNDVWLNELIWRDFYHMILWHFPGVETHAFKPAYDRIKWRNNEDEFNAWCEGRTGYPIVDAGIRELNNTGFMHNRVRMVVASFLTKHLLIDWRWGEAYFARKLLDFDLAANNGGWQWAAGSGCDAAPYFRIFNPTLQTKKFDSNLQYIKKWVPELDTEKYPPPIVDHAFARERALKVYRAALQ